MARSPITLSTTTRAGIEATYAAFDVVDGSYFVNNQNTVLHVVNADAAAHVLHIISQQTVDGKAVKDIVITIPNGDSVFIGPFSNAIYGSSGQVQVDIYNSSGVTFNNLTDAPSGTKDTTSVTVAAIVMGSL